MLQRTCLTYISCMCIYVYMYLYILLLTLYQLTNLLHQYHDCIGKLPLETQLMLQSACLEGNYSEQFVMSVPNVTAVFNHRVRSATNYDGTLSAKDAQYNLATVKDRCNQTIFKVILEFCKKELHKKKVSSNSIYI